MYHLVGAFESRAAAEQAASELLGLGIPPDAITLVSGEQAGHHEPPDEESRGIGGTIGAYVGGVVAGGSGLTLGTMAASMVVPGVGPVVAIGIGAAALLGLGGAVAGHAVGKTTEEALEEEHIENEIVARRELLKQGHSLLAAFVDEERAASARAVLEKYGARHITGTTVQPGTQMSCPEEPSEAA